MEKFKRCLKDLGALSIDGKENEDDDEDDDAMYFTFQPSKYREVQKITKEQLNVDVQIIGTTNSAKVLEKGEKTESSKNESAVPDLPKPPKLTSSVSDMIPDETKTKPVVVATKTTTSLRNKGGSTSKAHKCRTCGGSFETTKIFRAHYKSDWHRYNQKSKLKQLKILSEDEFNSIPKEKVEEFFAS